MKRKNKGRRKGGHKKSKTSRARATGPTKVSRGRSTSPNPDGLGRELGSYGRELDLFAEDPLRRPNYFGVEEAYPVLEEPAAWYVEEPPYSLHGPVLSLFTVEGVKEYRQAITMLNEQPELKAIWDDAYARAGLIPNGTPNKEAFDNVMERGLWKPVYERGGLSRRGYLEHREYLFWSCLLEGWGGYALWAAQELLDVDLCLCDEVAGTFRDLPFVVPGYEAHVRVEFFYHGLFDVAIDEIPYPEIGMDTMKHVEFLWEKIYEPAGVSRAAFDEANTRWVWGLRRLIIDWDKPEAIRALKDQFQTPGFEVRRDLKYDVNFGTSSLEEVIDRLMRCDDQGLFEVLSRNHVELLEGL